MAALIAAVMDTLFDALNKSFVGGFVVELVDKFIRFLFWLVDLLNDGLMDSLPDGKSLMTARIVVNHSIDIIQ
ncbi:MAG TPA: hypothetical protein VGG58_09220 [Candidatus Acidoferrum sp.]